MNELPDAALLEQLANQYFRAVPGDQPSPFSFQQDYLPLATQPGEFAPAGPASFNEKDSIHKEGHFPGMRNVPRSVAGSGISPSAIGPRHAFNISEPQTSLPDPHFAGEGKIPQSVAGSGISPSAIHPGQKFDISEPQTSLPDPHFAGEGKIPQSVAGSGISPSAAGLPDRFGETSLFSGKPEETNLLQGPGSFANPPVSPLSRDFGSYGSEFPYVSILSGQGNSPYASMPNPHMPDLKSVPSVSTFYFLAGNPFSSWTEQASFNPFVDPAKISNGSDMPRAPFDVNLVRRDFPILHQKINGKQIIWLDNAATTQKPKHVIERIKEFYETENSNVHRAAHDLAARATDAYESARKKVQAFLHASSPNEIVFVRGATEAINAVAKSWGAQHLKGGDEIILSHLEHHANIVPWQQLSKEKGATLKVIPVDDDGQILLDEYAKLLGPKTKLVSFTQVSNALGTVTPAKKMVEMAHAVGAKVLVDGAQTVSHMRADVVDLNCDWYVFSGHKVFGPTGIGVLYGREELLNETQPWQGGGNMIRDVTFEHTTYQHAPVRFEAGTGNIADAVGLGAAVDYVTAIGIDLISQYEHFLLTYATKGLLTVPGLRLIGTAAEKAGVISLVLDGYKTEEVGQALNQHGIAVRSGHHCAQPILRRFGLESTVRPSLALYNTCAELDLLIAVLHQLSAARQKKK
ncbi:MAG: family 2A encapsulin nanocompartment cargo protein cysteine desulfurase [Chitinophagales bacterium]